MIAARSSRILVVDDEEPIRLLLTRILHTQDYQVELAGDVDQALQILGRESIDAILLDLHMPGTRDGEELLFQLRDRGDDVPVIIVSGWVDDELVDRHPDCVHAVVKKPIDAESLLAHLETALA